MTLRLIQRYWLEPLPAFLSRLSVRRQKEPPPSRHGDGPYCYLKNPGFEPCPTFHRYWTEVHYFAGSASRGQTPRGGTAGHAKPPKRRMSLSCMIGIAHLWGRTVLVRR